MSLLPTVISYGELGSCPTRIRGQDSFHSGEAPIKKNATATDGDGSSSGQNPSEGKAAILPPKPEVKPLSSYDIFDLCVQRARNLVKLHEAAHGKAGKPEKFTSDAHRAAIVLAISALDAFVRDSVISRTRILLAAKTATIPPALSEQIKKFLKDDELLQAARKDDLLDRVEKAFRSDFEKRSFQGTKNIEEQFRIVGYQDIFHEVAIRAGVNEDTLRADLDRFTRRRHAIAHRGDYDLSINPPRENVVTKKDAEDCIKLVSRIAKQIHELDHSR